MTDKSGPSGSAEADVAFIAALAEMLRKQDLSEIEVSRSIGKDMSLDVRLARNLAPVVAPVLAQAAAPAPAPAHPAPAPAAAPAAPSASAEDPAQHPGAVTSPMVGTAYLQPEPGSEPFVKVGATVSEGQTLLIIEAMKTMNHIPAPRSGTVRRILIEDGAPVEYGAPLMIVD